MKNKEIDVDLNEIVKDVKEEQIEDVKEVTSEVALQYVSGGGPRQNMYTGGE